MKSRSPASSSGGGGWIDDIPIEATLSAAFPPGLEEVCAALWPVREQLFWALRCRGLGRWELSLREAAAFILGCLEADGSYW